MEIINITDKKQLNDFVGDQEHSQFLQSWEWGEFQGQAAGKIVRLGGMENNKLVMAATSVRKALPMGKSYFLCTRGPIGRINDQLFNEIKKYTETEGIIFLRFEPINEFQISNFKFQISKTLDVQPGKTLVLNLNLSEDELLKAMHQKTRYNLNLAERKGVKIVPADKTRFEEFWNLLDQTAGRDKFRPHGRDYYKVMIGLENGLVKLFFAEYQGKPLATALVSFFGDTATYLHGGSADENRNVMAPYLLHWQLIKLAKAQGRKYYDWHGIDEARWPGVTRFKKGFGGQELNYPGTFDLVFDPAWYRIYKIARKARRTF